LARIALAGAFVTMQILSQDKQEKIPAKIPAYLIKKEKAVSQ